MNSMKSPKILPWIAKRAGVREAVAPGSGAAPPGEAALIIGNSDSSDFFRFSVERFITLVEAEAGAARSPAATSPGCGAIRRASPA